MSYFRKANGKFLLTAEYAVLDGAFALAVPLKRGQWLEVQETTQTLIDWKALDHKDKAWFSAQFSTPDFDVLKSNDEAVSGRLRQIFQHITTPHSRALTLGHQQVSGLNITTRQDFDRAWGFGTSSTLIALIADWTGTDPYQLLHNTFGGSGYDIACAFANTPILYQRLPIEEGGTFSQEHVLVQSVSFTPPADAQFYLIYLNQKMNSREAIQGYRAQKSTSEFIDCVNDLTQAFLEMGNLPEAIKLFKAHETLLSARLGQEPVQERLFQGFHGAVKSMGAWGGDFVLAATELSPQEMRNWCGKRGFDVVFEWQELVM